MMLPFFGTGKILTMTKAMLEHFEFIGWVWDCQVFGGWEDVDSTPRLFSTGHEIIPLPFWQFQNVLILRKMG